MIPDDQVEEVRLRADIVDVIGAHVDLKKSGKEFKANCPFHEERTPSFYVVPDKGFYKCFGCGESGDVYSFLQKKVGMEFVEAVRYVAQRSGFELREVTRGKDAEEDPLRPLYGLMAFARDWFREQLLGEGGAEARAYLEGRGIDAETAERFEIGFAPDEWRGLRDAAAKLGYDDAALLEVGLLTTSDKTPEPYDKFRNRIVFPIEAVRGKIVAFGGRILGEGGKGQPKYLNSPETVLYHKSRVLYGLQVGRHAIRREESALVVEGYMDLVSLAAAGFENVVATLGTSMTTEHCGLLKRYTNRVLLLFDSDRAGLKATFRAGDLLLSQGMHPSVVTFPPGEDPDTLVQNEGPEALQKYLDEAVDLLREMSAAISFALDNFDREQQRRQYERDLHNRVRHAGLAHRVFFLGPRSDTATIMRTATLLVHAARQEPLGRVLLEAGATALPIVATGVGGTSEIFRSGHEALLVPPDSASQLGSAIRKLLGNPALAAAVGQQACERIRTGFSVDSCAKQIAGLYDGLCGS